MCPVRRQLQSLRRASWPSGRPVGAGPDFVVAERIDLEPFLEDVFMRWSEVAPRAWRLGEHPAGTVSADPEGLRIALDALLENAVKYTEASSSIELRSRVEEGELVIEVADEGCGVPAEALGRIFERFARSDPARTRAHGRVGLGLSIVDAIVKAHRGRCTVTSSENGATFTIRLPGFKARPATGSLAERKLLAHAGDPSRERIPST